MDYYINTIDDMQNEKNFFYHCNEFEYNQDFEQVLWKSDDALLEYEVLGNIVFLYEIDYYKFSFVFINWIFINKSFK